MYKTFILLVKYFIQATLTFPVSLLIWILISFIEPVLMISIWHAMLNSGTRVLLSYSQFVTYYLLSALYYRIVQVWSLENVSREIYRGKFSNWLLRPLFYLQIDLAHNVGLKFTRLITIIPIFFLAVFFYRDDFILSLALDDLLVISLSLILGFVLYFIMENAFALFAFWFEKMNNFSEVYYIVNNFLSGGVLPLAILPSAITSIVIYFPFRYLLSFPLEISLHILTKEQVMLGLTIELVWIIFFAVVYFWFLPKGLKRYVDVGR